jgi:hypothetical protein
VPQKGDSDRPGQGQNEHEVRISKRTALAATVLGLAILPLARVGLAPAKTGSLPAGCGGERWAVKTLADPAGRKLSLKARPTTIRKLRRAHAPLQLTRRNKGIERTTFRVTGRLVEMRLEDDLDVDLVIADPKTGATMIAAFPSATCTQGATRKARAKMSRARAALAAACGPPTTEPQKLSGTGAITGVGFFEPISDQAEGAAPNGIELHPVVAFTASSCGPVPAPPPPPPGNCAASYPTVCIPPPPPHLKCSDIPYANFLVRWDVPHPDPHHFDKDRDGIGCET